MLRISISSSRSAALSLAIMLVGGSVRGQTPSNRSLLTVRPIGVFGSLDAVSTRLSGATVVLSGVELAVTFNHRLSVGLAGYGLINQNVAIHLTGRPVADTFRFGHGGIRVGYHVAPERAIHGGIELLVGGGEASVRASDTNVEEDVLFVAVPGALVEANLTPSLRAVGAASYRFVSGIDWPGVGPSTLRGFEARIGLRVGRF